MKTTYQCKNCHAISTEIQHPSDEYKRDLDLCNKCRERSSEKYHFREGTKMIIEKSELKPERIREIKNLLNKVPKSPWCFSPGSDFDHWEIWSKSDGVHMVHDDSGIPPDPDFIVFVLKSREIIEELLHEIED